MIDGFPWAGRAGLDTPELVVNPIEADLYAKALASSPEQAAAICQQLGEEMMKDSIILLLVSPNLVLPIAMTSKACATRLVRSSLVEGMSLDYARTARAKGAPERVVLDKHALPNAMIPLLTILGFTYAGP